MPYILLLCLGIVLLLLLYQQLRKVEVRLLKLTIKWTALIFLLLSGIYFTLVGRIGFVAAVLFIFSVLWGPPLLKWMRRKSHKIHLLKHSMTKERAYSILQVKKGSKAKEIDAAYQQLLALYPKDGVGYDDYKRTLDEAREFLLKQKQR